jgi:hypothetical protein
MIYTTACVYDNGEDRRNVVLRLEPISNSFSRVECNKLQFAKYPLSLAPQDNVSSGHPFAQGEKHNFYGKGQLCITDYIRAMYSRSGLYFFMGVCEVRIERLLQASFILSEEPFLTPDIIADVSAH